MPSSSSIVNKELWTLYSQGARGLPFSLPQLAVQFPDYAVWQARTFDEWRRRHESYWKQRFKDAPKTRVPMDYQPAIEKQPPNVTLHIPFGKTLSVRLREMGQHENTSLPLMILAVYVCAMSLWCNQRDLVLAFISHGRHGHPLLRDMVGFLAASLPMRIQLTDSDSFLDLLTQIRSELSASFAHYDFDRVPELVPEYSTELGFNWVAPGSNPPAGVHLSEGNDQMTVRPFPMRLSWSGNVFVFFSSTAAGVVASVSYRPDLIATSAIERFGRHLRSFAKLMTVSPLARIASAETDCSSS